MVGARRVEQLLITELKHRLANSFQLLQAVVRIRLRSAEDRENRRHLSWLLDVVTALGMLQQRVSLDGPTDFGGYLIEAASYWRRVCEDRSISMVLNVAAVQVSEAQASTLALIIHELISNCIEHAFPEDGAGSIEVSLLERRDGIRELAVRDNGKGLAANADGESRQGLDLVRGLAAHLGGSVAIIDADGVTVRVLIPRDETPRPR